MILAYNSRLNLHHPRFAPIPSSDQREFLERAKRGDARARERLIQANMRFVAKVARRFLQPPFTIDELINEGVLGLNAAIDKFDLNRDLKFYSYAVWWIRQGMLRAIQDTGALIRTPAPYSYKNSPERIAAAEQSRQCYSLSALQEKGWDCTAEDADPTTMAESNSCMAFVEECRGTLSDREQDILWRNSGFYNGSFGEKTSMRRLAGKWGISENRVKAIRNRAVEKLQEAGLFSEIA